METFDLLFTALDKLNVGIEVNPSHRRKISRLNKVNKQTGTNLTE